MTELNSLYQEIILDHYKNPRNYQNLDYLSEAHLHENPTCGDSIKVDCIIEDNKIQQIVHQAKGCAISVSSASMMSEFLMGKTVEEAKKSIDHFISIIRGEEGPENLEKYDDLISFNGVIQYPMRVKCATLSWHALKVVLDNF